MTDNEVVDVYGPRIGPYGIAVYNVLVRYAQGSGQCWPSQDTIAKTLGIGRKKVNQTVKDLADAGLIRVERRVKPDGQTSSRYWLLPVPKRPELAPADGVADPPAQSARDWLCDRAPDPEPRTATVAAGGPYYEWQARADMAEARRLNLEFLLSLHEDRELDAPLAPDHAAD